MHRQLGEVGYTTERIAGAGKALSGPDAGGGAAKRKIRSIDWHGGKEDGHAEEAPKEC